MPRSRSFILVLLQFLLIAFFTVLLKRNLHNISLVPLLFISFSAILGVLSVINMGLLSRLNIFPELKKGSSLVTSGIYKYIRHPMYLAVILYCLGCMLTYPIFVTILLFILLVIDLELKMEHEEKILINELKGYKKYKEKTHKLIPFIW